MENATLKVNGNAIFINGANTPWNNWNDFGGSYNSGWYDNEFSRIKNAGGNATRIWITCIGEVGINIDSSGYVSGATQAHWDNLADMFQLAQKNQIYILACRGVHYSIFVPGLLPLSIITVMFLLLSE